MEATDPPATATPWSRPVRLVPAALALVVLLVALGRLVMQGGTGPVRAPLPTAAGDAGGPVFAEPTGTVLFFDDGTTGAVALDPDAGATERVVLPGQRAGDQPYRLWRVGEQLVVGRDEIVLVAPGPDGRARTLGEATMFLPAADPQQVWLIDAGTWDLVAGTGVTVASIEAIDGYEPVRGVPGGLAVRDGEGRLWRYDLRQDVLVAALGGASASWIGDVVRSQVAWCTEEPCRRLTIADAGGAEPISIGDGETFAEGEVWLSPDGDQVAAAVLAPADDGAALDRRLRIHRTADGELLADVAIPLGRTSGSWTVDGRQFFAWIHTVGAGAGAGAPAALLRWDGVDVELADVRSLGVEDVHDVVALPRAAVRGLFGGPAAACDTSEPSAGMGSLPAWRGEQVHVALVRPSPSGLPEQLWVGIPGADDATSVTVSARLVEGDRQAEFRLDDGADWQRELTVRSGRRTAAGFPPHWGLASRFPGPGCWAVTVSTGEVTETVVVEVGPDTR